MRDKRDKILLVCILGSLGCGIFLGVRLNDSETRRKAAEQNLIDAYTENAKLKRDGDSVNAKYQQLRKNVIEEQSEWLGTNDADGNIIQYHLPLKGKLIKVFGGTTMEEMVRNHIRGPETFRSPQKQDPDTPSLYPPPTRDDPK